MRKTFSPEYNRRLNSKEWRKYGKTQHAIWLGRDALIPLLNAHDIEHLTYANLGREWFIRDTIPLNKVHHRKFVTPLRALTKGRKQRVTQAQRMMAWAMRIWAILMLPVIWIVWGRAWAVVVGLWIALILF